MKSCVRAVQVAALILACLIVVLMVDKCVAVAEAAEPLGPTPTTSYVEKLMFRDGAIPKRDQRHHLQDELVEAIDRSAKEYGLDPALIASVVYAESGFMPDVIGFSNGELGLMQVHGMAKRLCEVAKLDLADPKDQIYCGSRWLRQVSDWCGGAPVADKERCISSKGKNTSACSGGLAAYLSGQCRPTKRVGWKVARRLKLADWAKKIEEN